VWGGGVFVRNSTVTFRRTLFVKNIARNTSGSNNSRALGGALASQNSVLSVLECTFLNNDADAYGYYGSYGGAVYLSGGSGSVRNCLMTGNRAGPNHLLGLGGAVYLNTGTTLENCTITTNKVRNSTAASGGGIYHTGGSVTNCIIVNNWNTGTATRNDIYTATPAVFGYNCSQDLTHGVNGNITSDPQFTDVAAGNYLPLRSSPCRNAGFSRSWMDSSNDLAGKRRILSGTVDMGCYEVVPVSGTLFMFR
jgi:hypothetical protein